MKAFYIFLAMATCGLVSAQVPEMPQPTKEHEWLKKFVGEWETEGECEMMGQKMKSKGTETCKAIGGFWIQGEHKSDFMGTPVTGIMTVGYDTKKKKYVGSWVCSMDGHHWTYTGEVSTDGKTLTLEAEGPNMLDPKKTCKFKDVTEFKSDKHRVMESFMLGEDGKWVKIMTMDAKKKAAK